MEQLRYFVLDNAKSNNTCVDVLLQNIAPHLTKEHRRLRCMGHIINLVAQALLFGVDHSVFEVDLQYAQTLGQEPKKLDLWRKKGPIGKLHNIVKFIRMTPQRREQFLETKAFDHLDDSNLDDLMVKSDNATRWNSADDMIERALQLRSQINAYCYNHQKATKKLRNGEGDDGSLAKDSFSPDEWKTLTEMHKILKPFKEKTMLLQGRGSTGSFGAAWEVLPTIFKLLEKTKAKQMEYLALAHSEHADIEHNHILHSLNGCIKKLEKYQDLLTRSPIYSAATAMNPTMKWDWFGEKRPEECDKAKEEVQQIWDDFYHNQSTTTVSSATQPFIYAKSSNSFGLTPVPQRVRDAYAEYISTDRVVFEECERHKIADW